MARQALNVPSHLPRERRRMVALLKGAVPNKEDDQQSLAELARSTARAELYWVTRDMAQAALDASTDMPGWDIEDLPDWRGLMVFEPGSLPAMPKASAYVRGEALGAYTRPAPEAGRVSPLSLLPDDIAVRAIQWDHDGKVLTMILWGEASTTGLVMAHPPALLPVSTMMQVTSTALHEMERLPGPYRRIASLLGACVTMMATPTVAEVREQEVSVSRSVAGPRPAPLSQRVTLVTLRRLARRPVDDEPGESGRVYTHQWVVRGHWRQQAVGKGRSERRTTWVPSYIKGPEGAPLLARERVNVWRR